MTLDVKKSHSSNETPNMMTVGVEKYGLNESANNNNNNNKVTLRSCVHSVLADKKQFSVKISNCNFQ
jgi:hypothetical protein